MWSIAIMKLYQNGLWRVIFVFLKKKNQWIVARGKKITAVEEDRVNKILLAQCLLK